MTTAKPLITSHRQAIARMKLSYGPPCNNRIISVCLLSLIATTAILTLNAQFSDSAALNAAIGKYRQSRDRGCYYMLQHYKNGEQIKTDEPCLNCTCENSMLMCYLRVCPFVKPVGDRCIIERVAGECCPRISCSDVAPPIGNFEQETEPIPLTTSAPTTTAEASSSPSSSQDSISALGSNVQTENAPSTTPTDSGVSPTFANASESALQNGLSGCMLGNTYYHEGAQMPSDPNKPCEVCYCIRNSSACVMQECALEVSGCTPIYQTGGCCPTRYNCSAANAFTTPRPKSSSDANTSSRRRFWDTIPGKSIFSGEPWGSVYESADATTTTSTTTPRPPIFLPEFGRVSGTQMVGCRAQNSSKIFADGERVPSKNKCEHCYCMRTEIVCAVEECRPPCDGCTAIIDPEDQSCCPKNYKCAAPSKNVPTDNILVPQEDVTTPAPIPASVSSQAPATSTNTLPVATSVPSDDESVSASPSSTIAPAANAAGEDASRSSVGDMFNERQSTPTSRSNEDTSSTFPGTINTQQQDQGTSGGLVSAPSAPEESAVSSTAAPQSTSSTTSGDSQKQEISLMTTRQTKPPLRPISPKLSTDEEDNSNSNEATFDQDSIAKSGKAGSADVAQSTPTASVDGFNLQGEREQEASDPNKSVSRVVASEGYPASGGQTSDANEVLPPGLTSTLPPRVIEDANRPSESMDSVDKATESRQPTESFNLVGGDRKARPPVVPSTIPGEGSCRYNGRLYLNGQEVKAKDNCMEICMCINSVVYCDEVDCPKGPTSDKCQRILVEGDCCPRYICPPEESTTASPSQDEPVTTAGQSEQSTTEPSLADTSTSSVISNEVLPTNQSDSIADSSSPTTSVSPDKGISEASTVAQTESSSTPTSSQSDASSPASPQPEPLPTTASSTSISDMTDMNSQPQTVSDTVMVTDGPLPVSGIASASSSTVAPSDMPTTNENVPTSEAPAASSSGEPSTTTGQSPADEGNNIVMVAREEESPASPQTTETISSTQAPEVSSAGATSSSEQPSSMIPTESRAGDSTEAPLTTTSAEPSTAPSTGPVELSSEGQTSASSVEPIGTTTVSPIVESKSSESTEPPSTTPPVETSTAPPAPSSNSAENQATSDHAVEPTVTTPVENKILEYAETSSSPPSVELTPETSSAPPTPPATSIAVDQPVTSAPVEPAVVTTMAAPKEEMKTSENTVPSGPTTTSAQSSPASPTVASSQEPSSITEEAKSGSGSESPSATASVEASTPAAPSTLPGGPIAEDQSISSQTYPAPAEPATVTTAASGLPAENKILDTAGASIDSLSSTSIAESSDAAPTSSPATTTSEAVDQSVTSATNQPVVVNTMEIPREESKSSEDTVVSGTTISSAENSTSSPAMPASSESSSTINESRTEETKDSGSTEAPATASVEASTAPPASPSGPVASGLPTGDQAVEPVVPSIAPPAGNEITDKAESTSSATPGVDTNSEASSASPTQLTPTADQSTTTSAPSAAVVTTMAGPSEESRVSESDQASGTTSAEASTVPTTVPLDRSSGGQASATSPEPAVTTTASPILKSKSSDSPEVSGAIASADTTTAPPTTSVSPATVDQPTSAQTNPVPAEPAVADTATVPRAENMILDNAEASSTSSSRPSTSESSNAQTTAAVDESTTSTQQTTIAPVSVEPAYTTTTIITLHPETDRTEYKLDEGSSLPTTPPLDLAPEPNTSTATPPLTSSASPSTESEYEKSKDAVVETDNPSQPASSPSNTSSPTSSQTEPQPTTILPTTNPDTINMSSQAPTMSDTVMVTDGSSPANDLGPTPSTPAAPSDNTTTRKTMPTASDSSAAPPAEAPTTTTSPSPTNEVNTIAMEAREQESPVSPQTTQMATSTQAPSQEVTSTDAGSSPEQPSSATPTEPKVPDSTEAPATTTSVEPSTAPPTMQVDRSKVEPTSEAPTEPPSTSTVTPIVEIESTELPKATTSAETSTAPPTSPESSIAVDQPASVNPAPAEPTSITTAVVAPAENMILDIGEAPGSSTSKQPITDSSDAPADRPKTTTLVVDQSATEAPVDPAVVTTMVPHIEEGNNKNDANTVPPGITTTSIESSTATPTVSREPSIITVDAPIVETKSSENTETPSMTAIIEPSTAPPSLPESSNPAVQPTGDRGTELVSSSMTPPSAENEISDTNEVSSTWTPAESTPETSNAPATQPTSSVVVDQSTTSAPVEPTVVTTTPPPLQESKSSENTEAPGSITVSSEPSTASPTLPVDQSRGGGQILTTESPVTTTVSSVVESKSSESTEAPSTTVEPSTPLPASPASPVAEEQPTDARTHSTPAELPAASSAAVPPVENIILESAETPSTSESLPTTMAPPTSPDMAHMSSQARTISYTMFTDGTLPAGEPITNSAVPTTVASDITTNGDSSAAPPAEAPTTTTSPSPTNEVNTIAMEAREQESPISPQTTQMATSTQAPSQEVTSTDAGSSPEQPSSAIPTEPKVPDSTEAPATTTSVEPSTAPPTVSVDRSSVEPTSTAPTEPPLTSTVTPIVETKSTELPSATTFADTSSTSVETSSTSADSPTSLGAENQSISTQTDAPTAEPRAITSAPPAEGKILDNAEVSSTSNPSITESLPTAPPTPPPTQMTPVDQSTTTAPQSTLASVSSEPADVSNTTTSGPITNQTGSKLEEASSPSTSAAVDLTPELATGTTTPSPADVFAATVTTVNSANFKPVDVTTVIPSIRGSAASITIPWSDISNTTTVSPSYQSSTTTLEVSTSTPSSLVNSTRAYTYEPTSSPSSSSESDYEEISEDAGCEYEGRTYNSAQQIPRSHPCDFCFCFRGDIICLQQTCPPPVPHCFETVIDGFCCPRYECPVHTVRSPANMSITPYETHSRLHAHTHAHELNNRNSLQQQQQRQSNVRGCYVDSKLYPVGSVIEAASGPCLECRCDKSGMMKCNPKECTPEDPLLQQINREVLQSTLSRSQMR